MARRPSVFVRALSMEEGRRLARFTRTAKNPVRLCRAIVVLMSAQGQAAGDATSLLQVDRRRAQPETLRRILHAGGVSWQTTST